jgi:hypothetical protein
MNVSLNNVTSSLRNYSGKTKKSWREFTFAPARYWQVAVALFGILLIIILAFDGFLFWRYVLALNGESENTNTSRLTLERVSLEAARSLLTEREIRFQSTSEETAPNTRNVFELPPAVPPKPEE